MDDPRSRPSLADDPNFLASLSELDRGLTDQGDDVPLDGASERPARAPRPAAPSRAPVSPPLSAPSPQPAAPTRPPASQQAPSIPPRSASTQRRAGAPPAQRTVAPPAGPAVPRQQPPRPAAVAPFPAPPGPPLPGEAAARRPLIDLFPPAPREVERPPDPMRGMSPGPRLPRVRPVPGPVEPAPPQDEPTYGTFYGLREKPFGASPDPRFLYHSVAHDRAVRTLLDAIRRRDGIIVVTGEAGVGKTMVCRAVADQLDRRTLTSFLGAPFVSLEDLLKTMLVDFGVISTEDLAGGRSAPLATKTRSELTETLRSFVGSLAEAQASAVVIVDDAHELPVDVLQHLGVLTGFDGTSRVLQAVFAGRPELLETLALPELKAFADRVTVRCDLGPLQTDEIAGYVRDRLAVAGTSARVEFDDGALRRAFELSAGNPRLLNLLGDRALALGRERSASVIDVNLIETAAEETEIAPVETEARGFLRFVAATVVLMLLMFAGAMAAAFVFRDQLSRVILQWEAIPKPPGAPAPRLPAPLTPIPEPPA